MIPIRLHGLPERGVEVIADDLGERLVKYIPDEILLRGISPDQMLDRISPDQMLDRISPDQMISHLTVAELSAMMEKKRWAMVQSADSAQARIRIINDIPENDRILFLAMENRSQLLEGLDEREQAVLLAWVESEEA